MELHKEICPTPPEMSALESGYLGARFQSSTLKEDWADVGARRESCMFIQGKGKYMGTDVIMSDSRYCNFV